MFLVDNLLLAPFNSLLWVFKEIDAAVRQETVGEAEGLTRSLGELYMRLETGAITEAQFEAEEKELLDRLDAIELRRGGTKEGEEADDASNAGAIDADGREHALRDAAHAPRATKRTR